MKTAIEFWWKGQAMPLTVRVNAFDGLEEVLAEALAECRYVWDDPAAAVPMIAAKLESVYPGTSFNVGPCRSLYTLVVDFVNRRVTDVDDDFRSKGFRKWLRSYDL